MDNVNDVVRGDTDLSGPGSQQSLVASLSPEDNMLFGQENVHLVAGQLQPPDHCL